MSQEELYKTINPVKYLRNFVEKSLRPDGRDLLEFRPTIINKDSIATAEGSAIIKLGTTTVICGIKAELAEPDSSEPSNGFIVPNIELTKLCSPKYRAIGVSLDSQIMNQTLYNILFNSGCVDLTELCIAKGKLVWVLYCDLVCLDDDGSVLDVASLALITALKSLKLPKVNYDLDTKVIKVDDTIKKGINLKALPVTTTFITFEQKYLLADPTSDEESIADTFVTIATCDGQLSYIYQPGGNSLASEQFESLIKQAGKREKYIISLLENIFE
ncbi:CLUMA_CG002200, isoform A [Clunio marinus]|uniref:Ribosomal RNA-processing protein 43 n=1 Tax=Clunio marinus TaxID=568069 RepID=A0A1J1HK63_9DIPT|nr:CLUMA_CG002200, isoform A [Clunio marinus]